MKQGANNMITQTTIVAAFPVTRDDITSQLAPLSTSFDESYKDGVKAIATCRTLRGKVEQRRKELKADAITFGREVDRVAKDLVALVEATEEPLKARKQAIDDAKAAEKRAAEEARLKAERERLEAEAAEQRAAQEAQLKAEREKLEAERAELDRARAELEELRAEKKRRDAIETAERATAQLEAQAAEQARVKAERAALEAEERAATVPATAPQADGTRSGDLVVVRWVANELRRVCEERGDVTDKKIKKRIDAVMYDIWGFAERLEDEFLTEVIS